MTQARRYFFCGIGGSGMLPLALILRARGHAVEGSDRSLDQGRTPEKFAFLRAQGIRLHPQDGSGFTGSEQLLVTSAAVEETVPDVLTARHVGAARVTRAELLAELFNAAEHGVAVGGTSGKSTTTGMIGWILHAAGRAPTIVNGAVMTNFVTTDVPFASAVIGRGAPFICEVDESDGSIALFRPRTAVLTNVALDHKPLEELRTLFGRFVADAEAVVVNADNKEASALTEGRPPGTAITFSLRDPAAHLYADRLAPAPEGIAFHVSERGGDVVPVRLRVAGRHNAANALAALGAARACGVPLGEAAEVLGGFTGLRRRLEVVGTKGGITVLDDFAHNPDKIAATLATLHDFSGRLLILFQPHGFGPLRLLRDGFIDVFTEHLRDGDILVMPDPVYYGGTVERTVTSRDIVDAVTASGHRAEAHAERAAGGEALLSIAEPGDRIVVMGARDDTLSQFAADLLARLPD